MTPSHRSPLSVPARWARTLAGVVTVACAVIACLTGVGRAATVHTRPRLRVTSVTAASGAVIVRGRVTRARPASRRALTVRVTVITAGPPSARQASSARVIAGRRFTVRVTSRLSGSATVDVGLRSRGRAVGRTVARRVTVTPSYAPCDPPAPPALAAGEGALTVTILVSGGPPGTANRCGAGTVTVTNSAGAVVATAAVPGPQSYAVALPAGSYLVSVSAPDGGAPLATPIMVTASDTTAVFAGFAIA